MTYKTTTKKPRESGKPPVAKLRIGLINAAIWERTSDEGGAFYSVTFERRYKDGDSWKSTHSYNADDLLALAKLADQAHTAIQQLRAGDAE
jgi:hypothetical protein